jgi:signal transduction histidine kinase
VTHGKTHWLWLLGSSLGLVAVGELAEWFEPTWRLVSVPLHATVEALGATIVLLMATLMLLLAEDRPRPSPLRWVSASLMAMGCLDIFHACSPPGELFVAFRSLATCFGGLLIAAVWLPQRWRIGRPAVWLPLGALIASGCLGAVMLLRPDGVPLMSLPDGGFSPAAMALNVSGGLGFLTATLRFGRADSGEGRLLASLCTLLGVSGLAFPFSLLWAGDWWVWHGLRLAGCLYAMGYLLLLYRTLVTQTREALLSREMFIRMASHELRTPLMPLLLRLQVMHRDLRDGKAVHVEAVEKAIRNVQQITTLVNGLIDTMQVGRDSLALNCGPISLTAVTREVVDTYHVVADSHPIGIEGPVPDLWVRGDTLRLGQVIAILLDNAVTYSPGGPVSVSLHRQDGWAALTVRDCGIGVPAADRPHVFEKFYRGSNFSPLQIAGLGLGLYISAGIVERHGGHIELASPPEGGTAVTVLLPLAEPPPAGSAPGTPAIGLEAEARRRSAAAE